MSRLYCVYILASRSRNLYTGVTNDLQSRVLQHRQGLSEFTARYRVFRLVYFEEFGDIRQAIAREKEIKGWRREKKIRLIESHNPTWTDLAEQLPAKHRKADPSHRSPKSGERVRDDNRSLARATEPPTPTPGNRSSATASAPAPRVIPNRASSPFDLKPKPSQARTSTGTGEGSAFSSTLPKPTSKP